MDRKTSNDEIQIWFEMEKNGQSFLVTESRDKLRIFLQETTDLAMSLYDQYEATVLRVEHHLTAVQASCDELKALASVRNAARLPGVAFEEGSQLSWAEERWKEARDGLKSLLNWDPIEAYKADLSKLEGRIGADAIPHVLRLPLKELSSYVARKKREEVDFDEMVKGCNRPIGFRVMDPSADDGPSSEEIPF